ncbi:MAG: hypothetical protein JW730_11520 [Anaerolineales bacterium]|nr:hypothetical protein [Anaerolineales bacterium]
MLVSWASSSPDPVLLDTEWSRPLQPNGLSLWSSGYVANQDELISRYGLSKQLSTSDLLLFLFRKMGATASAKLVAGPCSWMVWDPAQKLLLVVSDRMGLAPLYYAQFKGCLWIADDENVLLTKAGIPRQSNPSAVVAQIDSLSMLEDETIYKDIYKLTPGTVWTCGSDHSIREIYWRAELQPVLRLKDNREYAEALRALLVQVVDEHVPRKQFALTLSSGMDSSSIAGALRLARPSDRIPSIGQIMPALPGSNEQEWILATSQKLNLDLTELQVDQFWPLKPSGPCENLPRITAYQEIWGITCLEARKQGARILITGAMGDQCFGSSICSYSDLLLNSRWIELGRQIRHEWVQGYYIRPPDWKTPLRRSLRPLKQYIDNLLLPLKQMKPVSWLHPSQQAVYEQVRYANRRPFKIGLPARVMRWWQIIDPGSLQNILQFHKFAQRLGIEMRHPLWDHRILEFVLQLPAEQTYQSGTQKIVLRNAMRGILPDKVVELRKKIVPFDLFHRGLRERSVEQAMDLMTNMRLADMGYVLPSELQAAYQRYLRGETNHQNFFYTLMLESQVRAWY